MLSRLVLFVFFSLFLISCGGGSASEKQPTIIQADFDNDGQPDSQDTDDDNDGYLDIEDAFPLDANEWLDSDSDGTGNNSDTDDDNDGVIDAEDIFPLDPNENADTDGDYVGNNADHYDNDPACYMESDGDGSACYFTLLKQLPEQPIIKKTPKFIYFSLPSQSKILLLNAENQNFTEVISYDENMELVDFLYHEAHARLYLQFSNGTIKYLNATNEFREFPTTNLESGSLFAAGNFLVISDQNNIHIYDINALETDNMYISSSLLQVHWQQTTSTIFYTAGYQGNVYYIGSASIELIQGTIAEHKSRNVRSNEKFQSQFVYLEDNESLLFSSGNLISALNFEDIKETDFSFVDAITLEGGGLLSIQYIAGKTKLNWFDNKFNLLDERELLGAPKAIAGKEIDFTIITEEIEYFKSSHYVLSDDIDGDGVLNKDDKFPADISASIDTDNDGYPDEWNEGYNESDSTAGLEIDSFPNDSACWLIAHDDGSGNCDFGATMPIFTPDQVDAGDDGTIYLFSVEHNTVFRWSANDRRYLEPIYLLSGTAGFQQTSSRMTFSQEHQRLYFAYSNGEIKFVELSNINAVQSFANIPESVDGLASVGNFILAQDQSGAWESHYIFDINGIQVDVKEWNHYSRVYAWNGHNNRVYFFRDGSSPNDLHFEEIDQITGEIIGDGETPYHGSYYIQPPIRVSSDGSLVILGSGDLYDADTLNWLGSVNSLTDALWLQNNDIVTINKQSDAHFQLVRKNRDYTTVEVANYLGNFIRIISAGDSTFIVSIEQDKLVFIEYISSDDSDGDGVDNLTDAFPLDVAASIDLDNDGFPDTWNEGYDGEDSTTDLILDSFPNDSACWLIDHADENGSCDYSATMPSFIPDKVLADNEGIIYLLNYQLGTAYRWSSQSNNFINPIYLGSSNGLVITKPIVAEISIEHQRLYFGYENGEITFVDLTNIGAEQRLTNTAKAVGGLVAVGNYLMAQDSSGAWNTHYVFDAEGNQTDNKDWNQYSREYAWNEHNNRVYFFRDGTSPNDLHFEEIDQSTGEITSEGETTYHGSYSITPPIRVSNDGELVMLGSGDLYDANSLTWQGAVNALDDALWLGNGDLVTINIISDNSYRLERQSSALITVENEQYQGRFIRLLSAGSNTFIVSKIQDQFIFTEYMANDDSDGDGVDNLNDAFPMDPAASVDTDNDGFPDQWNDGYSAEGSTTSLTLDSFPNDSACWLNEHDNGSGQCDFGATLPSFAPDKVISDENGIVYLYNAELGAVYRWSVLTENYINPINIGQSNGLLEEYPNHIAYSQAHQRLYFGYQNGEITFVDLTNIGPEQRFANTAMAVGGLVGVGNYIMAQDSSGAWNTHYVFDEEGNQTDSKDWNRYSREYAWNEHNNRVYFFRDGTSPNDLHFEEIDQSTGEIASEGETPYHSSSDIRTPIRIIDSGQFVLLGSGNIYNAQSMELAQELSLNILDSVAFDDVFVVAKYTEDEEEWSIDIFNNDFSFVDSNEYTGEFVSIQKYLSMLVVITMEHGELVYSFTQLGDGDGDSIPAWWEVKFGLSDEDASDASDDTDGDGLNNLEEFNLQTSPILVDTDGDELTDFEEVNTYNTGPLNTDSDNDGLFDGDEVFNYSTEPLVYDTDSDGFSDGEEVLKYNTDPLDGDSSPQPITVMEESFESGLNHGIWTTTQESDSDWLLTDSDSSAGANSIRAGDINDNQQSAIVFSALFAEGDLSFDAKVSSESCCDRLQVYVDGEMKTQISNGEWQTGIIISVLQGEHTIEWRYSKDGSVSSGDDTAWIDNIQFVGQ